MKFEISKKITWLDKKGVQYFRVRPGIYETNDELEIQLLKGAKDAKLISEERPKTSESAKENRAKRGDNEASGNSGE